MKYKIFILCIATLGLCSCDSLLEVMQSLSEATAPSYNYGSYSTPYTYTSTSAISSDEKEWYTCSSCNGTGQCKLCKGSGKSLAKDGKCHGCDRIGNGKCPGCKGKGGWFI